MDEGGVTSELTLKVDIDPMLYLESEEVTCQLSRAVESGLLSEEEAMQVMRDFVDSKLPAYVKLTAVAS